MANEHLKKTIIEVINNQLRANNPPFVKEIYQELQAEGYDKKEAKEMIASVLLGQMYDMMTESLYFDEVRYERELREMLQKVVDMEYYEDDEDNVILQAKHKVYDADGEGKPSEAVDYFMEVWEDIKKYIVEEFYETDKKGNTVKPDLFNVDEKTKFKYEFFNWFQDMEMIFTNSRRYEERLKVSQDMIELFSWESERPDDWRVAIGESLNDLKRYAECDSLFEEWLTEEPKNTEAIKGYLHCAMRRNNKEKVDYVLDTYIDTLKFDDENDYLLETAIWACEEFDEEERRENYVKIQKELDDEKYEKYEAWDNAFLEEEDLFQIPIVKEKKIYPNEPCPCGSGKKYKKCCGMK